MTAFVMVATIWATIVIWIGVFAARKGYPMAGGTIVLSGLIALTVAAILWIAGWLL